VLRCNVDDTETTVQKPIRIIAKKGVNQVGKMASSKRVFSATRDVDVSPIEDLPCYISYS